MNVRLVSITDPIDVSFTPEDLIVYTARVSSPQNQHNTETASRLLKYCIDKGHWSIFSMVDMTIEIETSRAISAQILRHKSFEFQEFSQRYAEVTGFETYEARAQDAKNRQNSTDTLPADAKEWFAIAQRNAQDAARDDYARALGTGIAKECARFLLPMSASTRLYMKGSVRSWIHYFEVRCGPETQLEHREVALAAREIFRQQFPVVSEALWGAT